MTFRKVIACLLLIALSGNGTRALGDEPSSRDPVDCGTFALYQLLHLEGRPVDLEQLRAALGEPGPEGHSFRELRDAARRFGLALDAVVLPKAQSALRRPAIVYLKRDKEGHFLVARAIGHTGRLVQVIDGESTPAVGDAERLFASPEWTGLALVPHETISLAVAAMSASLICLIALGFRQWRRRRTQGPGNLSGPLAG